MRRTKGNARAVAERTRLAVTLAAMFLAVGCSQQAPTQTEGPRPVKTMVVAATAEPIVRTFPGRVESAQMAELSFQVPGLLVSMPVQEGQRVAKGGTIAKLREDEFRARLDQAQSQLDQARASLAALRSGQRPEEQAEREAQLRAADARLANAQTEFERYGRLVNSSAVSRSEYEIAETNYRVAQEDRKAALQRVQQGTTARKEDIDAQEAVVRGLDARVADAKLQLRDTTLRAPYDGVVAQRFVEEGQSMAVNKPVVRFQSANAIDIVADVPEGVMANDIRSSRITRMAAEISGAPGRTYPVRIQEIAQVADPTTQTFQVRFGMEQPSGVTILPGMTATVTVTAARLGSGNHILVPVAAISKKDTGQQVVWIMGPDQTVHSRAVTMGAPTGDDIEITSGVKAGDRIVVAGAPYLRDGMKVRNLGFSLGGG